MTSSFRIIYRPPGWRTPRQWPTQNFSSEPSVIAWTIKFLNVRKLTCVIIDRYQIHESEKEFVILRRERERHDQAGGTRRSQLYSPAVKIFDTLCQIVSVFFCL